MEGTTQGGFGATTTAGGSGGSWSNRDGSVAQALAIYRAYEPSGPFARIADSYVNAGFMQGSVSEFGYFFAGAPKTSDQLACP
jgi:hypothetical protein